MIRICSDPLFQSSFRAKPLEAYITFNLFHFWTLNFLWLVNNRIFNIIRIRMILDLITIRFWLVNDRISNTILWIRMIFWWFFENMGGYHLQDISISQAISHVTPYKLECSHWWKNYLSKKSFTRFALQSGCCNFNQWEESNL